MTRAQVGKALAGSACRAVLPVLGAAGRPTASRPEHWYLEISAGRPGINNLGRGRIAAPRESRRCLTQAPSGSGAALEPSLTTPATRNPAAGRAEAKLSGSTRPRALNVPASANAFPPRLAVRARAPGPPRACGKPIGRYAPSFFSTPTCSCLSRSIPVGSSTATSVATCGRYAT